MMTFGVFMAMLCSVSLLGLWLLVDRRLLRAASLLASETRMVAHGAGGAHVFINRFEECIELPCAINALADKLASARRDIDRAVTAQTARAEEQKSRLAAILRDLHEGVLVCNMQHQILLYNQTALTLLRVTGEHGLGLGRNLLQVVMEEPMHTLERLMSLVGLLRACATTRRRVSSVARRVADVVGPADEQLSRRIAPIPMKLTSRRFSGITAMSSALTPPRLAARASRRYCARPLWMRLVGRSAGDVDRHR
ncbi:hypothetical protein CCP2SC5_2130004 [Azospirillaceae bacterium]